MNIRITYSWLREYLDTDVDPYELQKYLSLSGPAIERIDKVGSDYILDVEITSNRIDTASVIGIAREAAAILPRFGKKAYLKDREWKMPQIKKNQLALSLLDEEHLSERILAIIFEGVTIKKSPEYIVKRLEAAGIRSLNNLVDITNYVMLEIGHPTHVFDYDKIGTSEMIFRKAKRGERITTLDNKSYTLYGGEVVIDDGSGRIIDLPSIMGTANSVVHPESKRIIFFIDNVNPQLIRKASMSHGIRTLAATYNEKRPDPEFGYKALLRAVDLIHKLASPASMSEIIDLYPRPVKPKKIKITPDFITTRVGVNIPIKSWISYLEPLGFKVAKKNGLIEIEPPSFRSSDVQIPEDIVEEVARIYGYNNLPSVLPSLVYIKQPQGIDELFLLQTKIKHFLKNLGLHEVMNYSMISEDIAKKANLNREAHISLKNAISEEIKLMRTYLLPSLFMNIKSNEGKREIFKFFEIAKTYKKRENDLPDEKYKLGIVVNTNILDLKVILDSLLEELHIEEFEIKPSKFEFLSKHNQAEIYANGHRLAIYGELSPEHRLRYGIKSQVYSAVFDFDILTKAAKSFSRYKPLNQFSEIKLDLTYASNPELTFSRLKKIAFESCPLLQRLELVSVFKNKVSLRFYFSSNERNITEDEAMKELKNIREKLQI